MGYIPPPGDNDDNGKKSNKKTQNTSKPISSDSTPDGTTITIINPMSLIPRNPSFGLIWGPLTPASDNRPAMYTMVALQIAIGVRFFRYARTHLRRHPVPQAQFHAPPGLGVNSMISTTANQTYSAPPQQFLRRSKGDVFKSILAITTGSLLIFGSGLEIARMMLPYDPWYDEAQFYRKQAVRNGDKPNFWFGAYQYYQPMTYKEWHSKVSKWIDSVEKEIKVDETTFVIDKDGKARGGIGPAGVGYVNGAGQQSGAASAAAAVAKPLFQIRNRAKYQQIHAKLYNANETRMRELLANELNDTNVNELNKAERLDKILEGKSDLVNPNFNKPSISLGNHPMESDDEFEMVWLNFEPWDELKMETDYDIRLIPRYASVEESEQVDEGELFVVKKEELGETDNVVNESS
ncbi:mitochondrial inner membrane i-AAA protease complex subunit [Lodderomyces elongisporus]|uniref:mitochondrial inner membrane i-AAA protease complex subunit n=1 Tax=Lodderomyces elongisporus TaxID=36914 RepID=UPI00291EA859|nr:mitochondrial inner membrane i-AAA protease complex subunit [Lodderomyces elongisporus]WLF77536.1 mitochondrial inner membrane i-AAA protease complex subunit [Lodderomyces elongisporus]